MNSVVSPLRMPSTTTAMHHASHAQGVTARHPRHAAPHAFQYQPAQPVAPQHADVLARAQAIAQAQAQIQAQMAAFAQQQQRSAVYHGPTARAPQTLHQLHQRSASAAPATASAAAKKKKIKSRSNSTSSTSSSTSSTASSAAGGSSRVEWRVAVDPKSKRPYYYHPVTRETTWKKPASLAEHEAREKRQFFFAMENNIRSKLRAGTWLRGDSDSPPHHQQPPFRHSDIGLSSSLAPPPDHHLVRSSLGSADAVRRQQLGPFVTRSAPTTPDFGAAAVPVLKRADAAGAQLDSTDDEDDDEHEELAAAAEAAAAAKPPMLFRTLSSYETPVVMEKKADVDAAGGVRLVTIPSPIQERVRLATGLQPRASDLESYTQSSGALVAAAATSTTQRAVDARQPLRRRSNSTSTIYVRMGTMNAPDQDCMITCVATVLRAHMVEAAAAPIAVDAKFDVFVGRRERAQRAEADARVFALERRPRGGDAGPAVVIVPPLKEIGAFIKHVFSRAQMESECIIMSLVYVERLLKATSGALQLRGSNWRAILFCSMVMASKVWDDLSMCNADFSKIWPELSLKEINELELAYLSAVEYNVRVSAVSYAKYYFHLRSMCASMGLLAAFDECAPLNLDGARKMQVLSEEFQERSKLMPAPRRRSVTITATSAASANRTSASDASKASPAASLEELVAMQVRGAGGSSLASMHRLSSLKN
ncbi:hypothetical protein PybrP1_004528 [[Pythium] brassicae (nom. inval.)]|nr:hypothetical protein PybrP1_004528 [[Pythium] brassicae (nom. inval.)]